MNNALRTLIIDLNNESSLLVDFNFKHNMNYELVLNENGVREGDISVVAVMRQEPTVDPFAYFTDAHETYPHPYTAYILADITGIPQEDAEALVFPKELLADDDVDVELVTSQDMAEVLRNYAHTGRVDFSTVVNKYRGIHVS